MNPIRSLVAIAALLLLLAPLAASAQDDVADVPAPLSSLDHVQATAETALNRAVWLDSVYDLAGKRLLCLGDHDLTSLAVAAVNPQATMAIANARSAMIV